MTRREAAAAALLDLVPAELRETAKARLDAYDVAFADHVYCTWCDELIPIRDANSRLVLRERMQAHQMSCPQHPMRAEIDRLKQWIQDLQSGMFVNCVYCGHRYGPSKDTPVSMAEVLKVHVEQCPQHPMSALKGQLSRTRECLAKWIVYAWQERTIDPVLTEWALQALRIAPSNALPTLPAIESMTRRLIQEDRA